MESWKGELSIYFKTCVYREFGTWKEKLRTKKKIKTLKDKIVADSFKTSWKGIKKNWN